MAFSPTTAERPVQVWLEYGDEFYASYSKFSTKQISPFLDQLQDCFSPIHLRCHSDTTTQTLAMFMVKN